MAHATMTTKGQITIPKSIREQLHLRPGMHVEFMLQRDKGVLLIPKTLHVKDLAGIFPKPKRSVSLQAMKRVIERAWAGRR
jgi:AbrB family looped-hinge helix DNA binding protein